MDVQLRPESGIVTIEHAHVDESSPNTTRPFILNIPSELLSLIVEIVAQCEPPRSPVSRFEWANVNRRAKQRAPWNSLIQGGSLGWIRLTHVCYDWRNNICGGMPLLWAQHIGRFRAPGALEEMVRRTGEEIPLDIQFGSAGDVPADYYLPWSIIENPSPTWSSAQCTAFRGRIRSLSIIDMRGGDSIERDAIPSIVDEMSELQSLTVDFLYLDRSHVSDYKYQHPATPVLRTPHLRRVRFTNYFLPIATLGMTHLSITLDNFGLSAPILHDLLSAISPAIQELVLAFCVTDSADFLDLRPTSYVLPRLQFLRIRDTDDCIEALLQRLRMPRTTELKLVLTPVNLEWREITQPITMHALFGPSPAPTFISMSITTRASEDNALPPLFSHFIEVARSVDAASHSTSSNDRPLNSDKASWHDVAAFHAALYRAFRDDWPGPVSFAFDLPVWKAYYNVEESLLYFPHIHHLRLINPLASEDLMGTSILDDLVFPRPAFVSPTSRLNLLWIVQHIDWLPEKLVMYCSALVTRVMAAALFVDEEDRPIVNQELPVALLRLDFIVKSGNVEGLEEKKLVARLKRIAERVELRFLR